MKRSLCLLAVSLAFVCSSFATTRVFTFIHQPLATLGSDEDAEVVVTRIPVLIANVPESIIEKIAAPYKVLQTDASNVPDSNLLSLMKIHLSVVLVSDEHYRITLDLRDMPTDDPYNVSAEEVIAGTVKCLQATFDELFSFGSYELRIEARKDDKTDWSKHEGRYEPKKKP